MAFLVPDCDFCKQADILLAKVQSNVWDFSTGWDMWDIQNYILLYTLYCTIWYYDILYDTDCLGKFYLIVLWFHVIPIYDISEARPTRYQNKCIFTYSLSKQSWIPLHGTGFTENCQNDNFWCRQSWRRHIFWFWWSQLSIFINDISISVYKLVLKHDDIIKWKHFPRYWPFVRGIHQSKGQWRWALMFSLICTQINGWVNNGEAGDLRCHRAHYDLTVMNYADLPSPRSV